MSAISTEPPGPRRVAATEQGGATRRVLEGIRGAIATLELPPGAVLDKAALAARFGVSRFPVSEALNRLRTEGLVDIRPQSGSTVSLIRLSDVRENMFLRRALEAEIAALLAERRDPALGAEFERNLRYQKAAFEAEDRPGFHRLDVEFHDLLTAAAGYPRVRATVESARLALDRVRLLLASPRRHAVTFEEHRAIVAAIVAGRPDEARVAMRAHIDAVLAELEAFSGATPEIFADREGAPR